MMQEIPCGAPGLPTPYLAEIQEACDDEYAVILPTMKCVAHADVLDGSEEVAPSGLLDCSTVVPMDPAGRALLLETMGTREPIDEWARTHFKNHSYQPRECLERPKDAVVVHLATLI